MMNDMHGKSAKLPVCYW